MKTDFLPYDTRKQIKEVARDIETIKVQLWYYEKKVNELKAKVQDAETKKLSLLQDLDLGKTRKNTMMKMLVPSLMGGN